MSISLRLEPDLESSLRLRLQREHRSLSDFLREAIREKLEREETTPFETGEPLFGRYTSGDGDRSTRRKALIREKVHARHRG